ncbi:MAG: STAS domain-containing protein [Pseudomonadota bacterium]
MENISEASGVTPTPIRPSGPRLDITNAHLLTDKALAQHDAGATALIIDMSEIDFVDSSGIGALVGLRRRLKHGSVTLLNVGGFVATVLSKTKTAPLFEMTST